MSRPLADALADGCPARGPTLSRGHTALALALLLGLQPITTDVFLPALPALTRALGATVEQAQLTMSALILAFGVAQLVWGPVADRVGRRRVLLAGLGVYVVASVGATLAGHIEVLVAWRVLQGATLAAAVVCARAIVRDLYDPLEGAQVMSLGLSGLAVIALLSPTLGGVAMTFGGWRSTLALVSAAGIVALAWVARELPETAPALNPRATAPAALLAQWRIIGRDRVFCAWTALISASYAGLFVFLAGSSYVYIGTLGMSPAAYGVAMGSGSAAYMAGTFLCRRWVAQHGMRPTVRRAAWFTLAGGASIVALAAFDVRAVWAVLLPQWLYMFAHGLHQPCGQTGAVSPFPRAAGAASALAGFVLAAAAFVAGLWLGRALDGTTWPFALGVGACALATSAIAWTLVQRLPPER